ncbi:MAG TPA: hypothetical protein VFB55_01650 [Verrucomicrobiae bacterium]|nr:hypothetical protein [Verrucomicrobiae bacterium]
MKWSGTLLALALTVAPLGSSAAPPPTPNPSATKTTANNFRPPLLPAVTRPSGRIERVGNISSRPWTEIVGWRPGASQFPDAENQHPQLILLTVNF